MKSRVALPPASFTHEAGPRGRTVRMRGVEILEAKSGGGDLIEHRRLHVRVPVVAGLLPAVIVAHEQDDVWLRSKCGMQNAE